VPLTPDIPSPDGKADNPRATFQGMQNQQGRGLPPVNLAFYPHFRISGENIYFQRTTLVRFASRTALRPEFLKFNHNFYPDLRGYLPVPPANCRHEREDNRTGEDSSSLPPIELKKLPPARGVPDIFPELRALQQFVTPEYRTIPADPETGGIHTARTADPDSALHISCQ